MLSNPRKDFDRKLLASVNSLSSDEGDSSSTQFSNNSQNSNSLSKWKAVKVTYAIMFFTSVSYSIQMPSLWPYMNIINKSYTKEFLGWVVGSYSIGQLFACPILSLISGKTGCFKLILLLCAILAGGGSYLYSIIVDIDGENQKTVSLLASRIIIGIAGANIASIRLFLTLVTTEEERIGPMSILSACQGLGFIVGPGIQAGFVPIGYPGIIELPFLRINMYTAAGIFGAITNAIIFVLIISLFKYDSSKMNATETNYNSFSGIKYKKVNLESSELSFINDYVSAVFMLVAFFVCMMSLAVLETSTTPISMDNFAWSRSKATFINSIILASSGICSLIIFVFLKIITKKIKEKYILVAGFVFILLSTIVLIPLEDGHIPIQYESLSLNESFNNGTGCDSISQPWCLHVPVLKIWQYGVSIALFTLGYPVANVLSYVIFSRLINPTAQSLWMGLLTASGSSARVVGPIFISKLYDKWGTQIAFGSWGAVIFLFLIFTPFFIWKMSKTEKLKLSRTNVIQ